MINLHDIRYTRLGTQDLDGAIRFATDIVGLQLVAREGNAAYFRSDKAEVRGDTRDHTLVYFEGDPADQTIGLELIDPTTSTRSAPRWKRRDVRFISAPAPSVTRGAPGRSSPRPIPAATSWKSWRGPTTAARNFPGPPGGDHQLQPRRPVQHRYQTRHRVLDTADQRPRLGLAGRGDLPAHRHRASFGGADAVVASGHPAHQSPGRGHRRRDAVYYWLKQQGVKIVYGPGRHPIPPR